MYEKVPKRLLPTEYGGEAGPLSDLTGALILILIQLINAVLFVCSRLPEEGARIQ
jgi:hypothetical protein